MKLKNLLLIFLQVNQTLQSVGERQLKEDTGEGSGLRGGGSESLVFVISPVLFLE